VTPAAALRRAPALRRAAAVAATLLVSGLAATGCTGAAGASSSDGGAAGQAATGQSSRTVAGGETLDQRIPDAAAGAALVDQDGRRLTLRSLRGRTVMVAPMLTMCQETCPMTSENMHLAAQDARRAGLSDQVVFLEVTVDPARDTVRRLHAYAELYGAVPDWRLATGRPAAVTAFWKALGVSTDKAPTDEPVRDWMTGRLLHHSYDVHHQDVVVAVDAAGRLRWITVGRPDARGGRLPTTMRRFLDEEGRHNLARPAAGGAGSWTASDVDRAVHYVRGLSG
jgi:cytochrome oxidase Cu insertion factor (SCO1/SenC/PrrC family)